NARVRAPASASVSESSAAEAQQQHCQGVPLLAEIAEPLDHGHLPVVHQTGAAGGHADLADLLGDLRAALDRGQDLRVEPVDLGAQRGDVDGGRLGGGYSIRGPGALLGMDYHIWPPLWNVATALDCNVVPARARA